MTGKLADQAMVDLLLTGQEAGALQAIADSATRLAGAQGAAICLIGRDQPVCIAVSGDDALAARNRAASECRRLHDLQLAALHDEAGSSAPDDNGDGLFRFRTRHGAWFGVLALSDPATGDDDYTLLAALAGAIPALLLKAGQDHQLSADAATAKSESLHLLMAALPEGLHGARSAEEKLAILMAAARDIIGVRSIETLQWHVAQEVVAKLGFLDCLIYRYDADAGLLHQSAAIGEKTLSPGIIINPLTIPLDRGITGAVASTRQPLLLENAGDDPRYVPDVMAPGSELCVPILYDDRLLGVIDCEHPQQGWFTQDDLQMLTGIASLMASQWVQCELTDAIHENAQRLKKAERAAAAANKAKSVFVANMSHEIRTPLHGVLGAAQLLARSNLDARQSRFIDIIQSSGQTLLAIIEEVLDISHIETGEISWTEKPFDLSATIFTICAGISVLAKQKGLAFTIELAEDLPKWVTGDPKRFGQILTNFLGNAVKYTERGSVALFVSQASDGQVRMAVTDTGPGLTASERELVFERFSRLDEHAESANGGAGLGLSICKEYARIGGGRIGVDSRKGEGSTFWCELPMPATAAPADAPESLSMPIDLIEPANDRDVKTVLVVDDAETNRLVLRAFLEQCGYRVLCAENGAAAIEIVRRGVCDAVLMDIRMPIVPGDVAIKGIRKLKGPLSATPIFAVTGDATPETREALERIGADDFFTKPLDLSDIQTRLDRVLRGIAP